MNIRDANFNNVSKGQNFADHATFEAKVKTDALGKKIVVFKNKEVMKSGEHFKEIMKMIGITLATFFTVLALKEVRKDWKKAISGKNKKIIQIPIPKGFTSGEIFTGNSLSLTQLKDTVSLMEIMKKIKNGEEKIEFDANLLDSTFGKKEFPGYELKFEAEDSKNLEGDRRLDSFDHLAMPRYYLVKILDNFDNLETFNQPELRTAIEKKAQKNFIN